MSSKSNTLIFLTSASSFLAFFKASSVLEAVSIVFLFVVGGIDLLKADFLLLDLEAFIFGSIKEDLTKTSFLYSSID